MIQIKTLAKTSLEKITDTFNLAFSDYFVPIHLTLEQLSAKMKSDRVNLEYSVGAFEEEELIGFILHGTDIIEDKKVAYNGGTGVIPSKRGKGLTKQMYDFILPRLKEEGIDYLTLEVIFKNIQAIKSYERVGFKIARELKCYKGQTSLSGKADNVTIKELAGYDWDMMQSFWDFTPTWQNSAHALDELKSINKSLGAYIDGQLTGFIIYNPGNGRIQQIAVHKDFRRKKIASALIASITKEPGTELSIVNIDKNSEPLNSFLLNIGLENYIDQLDMKLEL